MERRAELRRVKLSDKRLVAVGTTGFESGAMNGAVVQALQLKDARMEPSSNTSRAEPNHRTRELLGMIGEEVY